LTVNENFITLNSKQVALQAERFGGARVCGFTFLGTIPTKKLQVIMKNNFLHENGND